MSGITFEQAQAQLQLWLAADARLSKGQSYSVAGRSVTRAETSERIEYWDRKCKELEAAGSGSSGGRRVRHGVMIQ